MMLFGDRPTNGQAAFEQKTMSHKKALSDKVKDDDSPDYSEINKYIKAKPNQIWGDIKVYFMKAQNRKCGFCEVKLTESTGDVEHYRPKNAIWNLRAKGRELNDLVNIRGRKYYKIYESGYWWLAYSWNNYLVACPTCNQKWKSALFPISGKRRRPPKQGDELTETPLLLDPFGKRNPSKHLSFDDLGQIEAYENSRIGKKTIETCGLDRESLRSSRFEKSKRAHRLVQQFSAAIDTNEIKEILEDFMELGNTDYIHSGMVRAIFEQEIGISWSTLK